MTRLLSVLFAHVSIDFAEQLAGHLLYESGKRRIARADLDDAHETRHLFAALRAGDSSPCGRAGRDCHLDAALIHDFNVTA